MRLLLQKYLLLISTLVMLASAHAADLNSKVFAFQQALANNGNLDAQFKLAYLYETGRGVEKNWKLARQWYSKAAAKGFKAAAHRMKYLELLEHGVKQVRASWLTELTTEAQSDANVMFLLANMYELGTGVKKDFEKARQYYKRSTAGGNADAEARLFRLQQQMRRMQAKLAEQKAAELEKQKAKQLAEKKLAEARAAREKAYREKLKKQQQLQAENERKRQAEKKRAIKLAEKKKAAEAKHAKSEAKTVTENVQAELEKDEGAGFETELCQGKAAKFRTQCN